MTLDQLEKFHVLTAIVKCNYELDEAAAVLHITLRTLYRMLNRWKLETPMKRGSPHTVKWSEHQKRCTKILSALESISMEEKQ